MNFVIIALSIIIIFLLFLIYRFIMGSSPALVTNISLKSGPPDIALSKLKIKNYGTYNINFWIYVNELPDNDKFSSFSSNNIHGKFGNANNAKGCILQTSSNKLSLDLYSDNTLTFYNGRNSPAVVATPAVGAVAAVAAVPENSQPSVFTNQFPVQKWTYVIVSVQNNTLVDLYINGKLVQSVNYNGGESINKIIQPESTQSLQFGKQLNALITKLYINPVTMNPTTAWNNYLKGNGSKSNMNISFDLTENGKNSSKFKIL